MKKSLAYFWLAAVLALAGCASVPVEQALSPEQAGSVRDAEVYVVFPQKELYALYPGFSVGGNGEFGLIGYAINQYENSKAFRAMKANVAPVAAVATNLEWGRDLEAELRRSKVFADARNVNFVALPEGDEPVRALVKSAKKPWVVVVNGAYYLDAWYRVLTLGADVSVWQRDQAQPVHTFRSVYYSRPITPDIEFPIITGRMAPLWAKDNGAPLRRCEAEGASEVASLIRTALIERPSNVVTPADTLHNYVDWDRMQALLRKAKLLATRNDRATLVDENGRLLSVFSGPTYASIGEARRPLAPGMARVYVYQGSGMAGYAPSVHVNGANEGLLYPGTYFALDVKPGTHTFALQYDGDVVGATLVRSKINAVKPVTLDASAGGRYFVRFEGYKGLFTSSEALKAVPAAQTEAELPLLAQRY